MKYNIKVKGMSCTVIVVEHPFQKKKWFYRVTFAHRNYTSKNVYVSEASALENAKRFMRKKISKLLVKTLKRIRPVGKMRKFIITCFHGFRI